MRISMYLSATALSLALASSAYAGGMGGGKGGWGGKPGGHTSWHSGGNHGSWHSGGHKGGGWGKFGGGGMHGMRISNNNFAQAIGVGGSATIYNTLGSGSDSGASATVGGMVAGMIGGIVGSSLMNNQQPAPMYVEAPPPMIPPVVCGPGTSYWHGQCVLRSRAQNPAKTNVAKAKEKKPASAPTPAVAPVPMPQPRPALLPAAL